MTIKEPEHLFSRVQQIFKSKLHVEIPSVETDIIDSAILDSLMFVDLLLHLEQEFGIKISQDNLEIDNFRSIKKIAEFITKHNGSLPAG